MSSKALRLQLKLLGSNGLSSQKTSEAGSADAEGALLLQVLPNLATLILNFTKCDPNDNED